MLVLTRKIDEAIQIGPDIRITILSVKGGRVRLGIDAPRGVPIRRPECSSDKKPSDPVIPKMNPDSDPDRRRECRSLAP